MIGSILRSVVGCRAILGFREKEHIAMNWEKERYTFFEFLITYLIKKERMETKTVR